MDALRFATTKIQPPRPRGTRIARPGLEAALGEALRTRRVVLLVAPAGFGKTSALAAQIGQLRPGTALAWVSLDEDDDSAQLFACLAAALEPCDLPWRSAPASLAGEAGAGGAGARHAVAELVNALAAAEVAHGVIVLDDLHRVQAPQVVELLDALIEWLPPQWTLVIATRVAPPIALARLRASGELAEFLQDDLRFSADEARTLAAAEQAPELGARLPELFERTQGWPAGLRLYLTALRMRPGAAAGPLAGRRPAAVDRTLFDYLASEVLDDMPAELHDFLVRSSVLPVLTAEAAAAVTGDTHAAQRLDEVERRGLFVTALDAQERTLVLHDLFRDALEDRLRKRFPTELAALLQRAAAVEHDPVRRIGLALRAGDWQAAEASLVAASDDMLLEGLATDVQRLVAQFPSDWRERSSRLLRLDGIAACMRWHWGEMAARMESAVTAARHAGDVAELQLSQACLLAAWNATGRDERSRALMQALSGQALSPHAAVLVLDAQCTLHFQRAEYDRLPALFGRVMQGLEQLDSLLAWWECSPPTAWAGLPGMRSLLERYCSHALRRCGERDLPMRASLYALQAATQLWAGRIDNALAEARQAESDARWLARAAEIEVALDTLRVVVDSFRGDAESVQRRLQALFTHEDGQATPDRLRFWHHHVGRLAVRVVDVLGSDAGMLRHWGAQQRPALAEDPPDPLSARIAAAEGRWHEAAQQFVALLPHAPRLDLMGQGTELHLRAAHALLQCGRQREATPVLRSALERVLADGEAGHALMAGPAVLAALAAQDWGQAMAPRLRATLAELAGQAARLRGDVAAPHAHGDATAQDVARGALALLSSREREVLERVAAGDSNKLIARALDISPHTVKRHVANILDKLALASRGQAAAWLRQQA